MNKVHFSTSHIIIIGEMNVNVIVIFIVNTLRSQFDTAGLLSSLIILYCMCRHIRIKYEGPEMRENVVELLKRLKVIMSFAALIWIRFQVWPSF